MYQAHWGLGETPFPSRLDRRFFHEGATHEEALARLLFLVEQRRRLGLLMGQRGSGKSFLLEMLAQEISRNGSPVVKASLLGVEKAELPELLGYEFGLNLKRGMTQPALWRLLSDRLAEYRYQHLQTLVLLDDADQADDDVLTQVYRLAQLDLTQEPWLTIVLAGHGDQIDRLGPSLLELAELRIDLEPWEPDDTASYISNSLAQAGRTAPVFAEPALARLHELAEGVPRRISHLADMALLAGAGRDLDRIDVETVEFVYHELGVIEV